MSAENSLQDTLSPGNPRVGTALLLVGAGAILWEILLTRIYSVLLFYHFAFMAVSIAMFGLTLGAVLVFLRVGPFSPRDLEGGLGRLALATGALMAAAIAIQLALPLRYENLKAPIDYLLLTYLLSALPFVPAGAFICLTLTRFGGVGALYAYDLGGAALGCLLIPLAIGLLGGPGAVLVAAAMACTAAFLLLRPSRSFLAWCGLSLAAGLVAFAAVNATGQWLRVRWRHDGPIPPPLHEKWNAFSRIMVTPYDNPIPFGWGIDPELSLRAGPVAQLWLQIDSGAGTPITSFDGNLGKIDFLRYDVSSFAHHLRPGGDAFVIGPGGGRDVLAALAFRQRSVKAAEVNPDILQAVNGVFGEFTGHLDRRPDVRFAADEGRSHLAGTGERFDIIQASFVDTVAATAAGAFAFTENGLYTVEGWKLFLGKLKPRGILTFSRFYYGSTTWPVEVYRSMALAAAAVRSIGAADPGKHILLVRTRNLAFPGVREGIATILVSPDPFSDEDLERAGKVCGEIRCEVAWGGKESLDPNFALIVNSADSASLAKSFPLDVTAPTDDRPYFFFHARVGDILLGRDAKAYGGSAFNLPAVRLLVTLTILVLALGIGLVAFPALLLAHRGKWSAPGGENALLCIPYFTGIGLAFMFVEIGLMQRLSLFLGHPTYGFTVVLFGLLLSGGLGSLASESVRARLGTGREWLVLLLLAVVLAGMDAGSSLALSEARGAATAVRILLTLLLICPPAFLMGFAFPMGMDRLQRLGDAKAAWYWALNGAFSVVASVLAMVASLGWGIRATIWIGIAFYAGAAFLYRSMVRGRPATATMRN